MDTMDWGNAVVVSPQELGRLKADHARLRASHIRRTLAACFLLSGGLASVCVSSWQAQRITALDHELRDARKSMARAGLALTTLARSHENILAATEQAPSVGTKSWGRRFTVTKYTPRSPKYGKFNDGITSTLIKADPAARIVAVDPKLIPYHSWVWIEDLGWYRAEDCGVAIKGFRLDLLTSTEGDALTFGKQDRFAIVVPADA
jgi:3D (Asp-Asp-Asp) domain-containing protein